MVFLTIEMSPVLKWPFIETVRKKTFLPQDYKICLEIIKSL